MADWRLSSGGVSGDDRGGHRVRMRNRQAVLAQALDVELDRLGHLGDRFGLAVTHRHTSGQVRTPRAVATVLGALDDDHVGDHNVLRSSPACPRMLRSVPIGNTLLGLPGTVTRPFFVGYRY